MTFFEEPGVYFNAQGQLREDDSIASVRIMPAFVGSRQFFAKVVLGAGTVIARHHLTAGNATIVYVECNDSGMSADDLYRAAYRVAQHIVKELDAAADPSRTDWH